MSEQDRRTPARLMYLSREAGHHSLELQDALRQAQSTCLRCGFERHADLNAANNIAKRGGVDFDTPNTPDRAAVRSDGPESRPKAGRSGRLAMPDNPVTLPVAL